jgi:predicted DNA-binding protein (MmcQ/YjbR family)
MRIHILHLVIRNIFQQVVEMKINQFNSFCKSLPHSTTVVQWGGSHVWKIGGKMFAIGGWQNGEVLGITFKCSPLSFQLLQEQKGCRPAPYLASRGMKWIQRTSNESLDDDGLKLYLKESYRLVLAGLSKKRQTELQ